MGKRTHAAATHPDNPTDDAARRTAKKHRKTDRTLTQLQQHPDTVDPAHLLVTHGGSLNAQAGGAGSTAQADAPASGGDAENDSAARARRKADRKAAKRAAKEAAAAEGANASSSVAQAAPVPVAEDDERARKKAKKEAKRAKKAAAAMEVEQPTPIASTSASTSTSTSSKEKKDKSHKKDKKDKRKSTAASLSSQPQDQYLPPQDQPVDPTLAGLLSAEFHNAPGADIPVFSTPYPSHSLPAPTTFTSHSALPTTTATSLTAPFQTGPSPFATSYHPNPSRAGDIPVSGSPYSRAGDIPVDPVLLLASQPSSAAGTATASASTFSSKKQKHAKHARFAPAQPPARTQHARDDDFDVAAVTARALLMAKEQHARESRARREAKEAQEAGAAAAADAVVAEGKKGRKDKGKKDKKGKGKAPEQAPQEEQQENEDEDDLDAILASARRAAPALVGSAARAKKPAAPAASSSSTKFKAASSKAAPKPAAAKAATTHGSNDFYEQLVTKWMPVKELKKLAEETGSTYKQGKFSATEDATILSTLEAFRDRHDMAQDELVTLMTTKRTDKSTPKDSAAAKAAAAASNEAWELVARALGDRSLLAIYNHVNRLFAPSISGASVGRWTAEEDEALRAAVRELGNQWEEIGKRVGSRTGGGCRDRWTKQLAPGEVVVGKGARGKKGKKGEESSDDEEGESEAHLGEGGQRKGKWTAEEEEELRGWVDKLGKQWSLISRKLEGRRSATQCRTKWNDFLNRRDQAPAPPPGASSIAAASTSRANRRGASAYDDDDDEEEDEGLLLRDKEGWRWRPEHASSLVHAIASLPLTDETEIDWKSVPDPTGTLSHHGAKNLRDRFRHLLKGAKGAIEREREGRGRMEEGEISFKAALAQLLKDHPIPNVAPSKRRPYSTSRSQGTQRSTKLASASAGNAAHILAGDGAGGSVLSREMVDSSDDEEEGDGREGDLRVHDDESEDDEDDEDDDEYEGMRMEDVVVDPLADPLADFHKGLVDQLARAV
ncbi:hypothetical protein JCM6882_003676 [Rhodosporidiobolus microsporus]